jgi:hypothetical protein
LPSAVGVHVKMTAFAVPAIAIVSVSPETFNVHELIAMVTVVFEVEVTGTVTAQVCPLTAVAVVPATVKLTLHMTPEPVSVVATCVGSTLTTVIVSPVRSTGVMAIPEHIGSIEPEPNVQLPAKAAAGSPELELLPQPNRKSAAATPHRRTRDDFTRCMGFSLR